MATDPYATQGNQKSTLGTKGVAITPDDDTDLDPIPKAVVVTSIAGGTTLEIKPMGSASMLTFEGVSVGYIPPYRVIRVGESTDCSVATVAD